MNVKEVTDAVLSLNGGKRFEQTCDQLIIGDWKAEVTGVATTFMATVDVIRRSIAAGCNLIITHEPTWFTGRDDTEWLKDDPTYQLKRTVIESNGINIWRFHDHMHAGNSDIIYDGLLKDLGWEGYLDRSQDRPHVYNIPEIAFDDLVTFLKEKLEIPAVRVIGQTEMVCRKVGILVGGGSLGLGREEMPAELMYEQDLDVMVCGEITEWTFPAYIRDAAALGLNKAMIIIGHERTEEQGMKHLAERIETLTGRIPVTFIDSCEPFINR